jgi:hypothetical protein
MKPLKTLLFFLICAAIYAGCGENTGDFGGEEPATGCRGGQIMPVTPSVSDEILSRQLSECFNTSSFLYEIAVKKCTDCRTAIGYHYFWAIYDRKLNPENVSLRIKAVE